MIRTYNHKHDINKEKQEKVLSVLRAYRKSCTIISRHQWRLLYQADGIDKMIETKNIITPVSERYKRNCCYQVDGSLKSFIANRQNDFVKMIFNSSIDSKTRKHLFQINRRRLWFKKAHEKFTSEELFLARKIFKRILAKHRKPSFRHANMLLNKNVAEIITADKTRSSEFDYWIKLATLEKGKPIMLPIRKNPYFEKLSGEIQQAVQINFGEKKEITIGLMKDLPSKHIVFKKDIISIDIGLKNLFVLNNGDIFGRNFYLKLKHYDFILTELAKNRQRQGFKTKSKKYTLLVKRLKSWIKNEVRRLLNRIVKLYAPKKIVIERLDFRNQNISKWMNRLLCNFGKGEIIKKLDSLEEEFGITYQEIPAPYTSQECPNPECGYVDEKNRPSQEKFCCKNCGYTRNADVVGSRNGLARSSDKELSVIYLSKKVILQTLVMRFLERHPRLSSRANGLLLDNPYYKDYLSQSKIVA